MYEINGRECQDRQATKGPQDRDSAETWRAHFHVCCIDEDG